MKNTTKISAFMLLACLANVAWSQSNDGCPSEGECDRIADDVGVYGIYLQTDEDWVGPGKFKVDFQIDLSGLTLTSGEMLIAELSQGSDYDQYPLAGEEIIQLWISPSMEGIEGQFDLVMAYSEYDINGNPTIQGNSAAATIGTLHNAINDLTIIFNRRANQNYNGLLRTMVRDGRSGPLQSDIKQFGQELRGISPNAFGIGILDATGEWSGEVGYHAFMMECGPPDYCT